MKRITARELAAERGLHSAQWVDVRSASEYAAGHVPGAVNIPLEQIEARLDDLGAERPVVLICQGGQRAAVAGGLLAPHLENMAVLEGGTKAWAEAGLPLVVNARTRWSLERQVRLGAGVLVLTGVLLAVLVNPAWVYLAGFAGLGLTFAGATDFCAMGILLGKMPWNRPAQCPSVLVERKATWQGPPCP